ncbi:MAG: ribulose-phosphate 3-epimerase, partial [Dehalococcoidia bacterium]
VHMMVEQPERYVDAIAHAGGSIFTAHIEATQHIHRVVQSVKAAGMKAGVAINPGTPVGALEAILPDVDLVLVMSVNPGWGGQPFLTEVLAKVRRLRATIDSLGLSTELEMDGGITKETAPLAVEAGANVLVAGTAVFNEGEPIGAALTRLRRAVESGAPA